MTVFLGRGKEIGGQRCFGDVNVLWGESLGTEFPEK
jgi:hypothetical protein